MFRASDFYSTLDTVDNDFFNQYDGQEVVADVEQARFYQLVFECDVETGNPRSDVSYLLTGHDEGFKQYIKDNLFKPNPQGSLADTPEEAEALIKPNLMTAEMFASAAKDYVVNMMRSESEKGD